MPVTTVIGVLVITALLVWMRELTTAVRQRSLTKSLLAVLKRIPAISQDERSESERAVAAASLILAEIAWPRRWLRRNVEAARTVLASIDGVPNHFASGDKGHFARLLDLEQALLVKRKVALDGVWCSHLSDSSAFEKKLIVPVLSCSATDMAILASPGFGADTVSSPGSVIRSSQ